MKNIFSIIGYFLVVPLFIAGILGWDAFIYYLIPLIFLLWWAYLIYSLIKGKIEFSKFVGPFLREKEAIAYWIVTLIHLVILVAITITFFVGAF